MSYAVNQRFDWTYKTLDAVYSLKLGDYWPAFKHPMINILPNETLYMSDIICAETILYRQEATRLPFSI